MIHEESHLGWYPIAAEIRKEVVHEIKVGHIQAQDGQGFHVGEITQDFYEIFEIEQTIERPYEYFDNIHVALNYEMNLNLFMYEREVYTTLDWFGNIGGLA